MLAVGSELLPSEEASRRSCCPLYAALSNAASWTKLVATKASSSGVKSPLLIGDLAPSSAATYTSGDGYLSAAHSKGLDYLTVTAP